MEDPGSSSAFHYTNKLSQLYELLLSVGEGKSLLKHRYSYHGGVICTQSGEEGGSVQTKD